MSWWNCHGDFDPGYRGYPNARQVLRYYRKLSDKTLVEVGKAAGVAESRVSQWETQGLDSVAHLRSIAELLDIPLELFGLAESEPDDLGKTVAEYRVKRGWTRAQLAQALDLTEGSIYFMEKQNTSLDSLERRRALQFLLTLPPALLGLDALHLMESSGAATAVTALAPVTNLAAIQTVQESLWTGYYIGNTRDQVVLAKTALSQIKDVLPSLPSPQRETWLIQQSLLYQGLACVSRRMYARANALIYLEKGVKSAGQTKDVGLLSSALLTQMETAYQFGDQEFAVKLAKDFKTTSTLDPLMSADFARVLALDVTDQAGRSRVLSLIDEQYWSFDDASDPYSWQAEPNRCLIFSSEAYLNLSTNKRDAPYLLAKADELLARVDPKKLSPSYLLLLKVVQARIALARREYKDATNRAIEASPLMQEIQSRLYLPQLGKIYHKLQKSSYAKSKEGEPLVARLGWLLFQEGVN